MKLLKYEDKIEVGIHVYLSRACKTHGK